MHPSLYNQFYRRTFSLMDDGGSGGSFSGEADVTRDRREGQGDNQSDENISGNSNDDLAALWDADLESGGENTQPQNQQTTTIRDFIKDHDFVGNAQNMMTPDGQEMTPETLGASMNEVAANVYERVMTDAYKLNEKMIGQALDKHGKQFSSGLAFDKAKDKMFQELPADVQGNKFMRPILEGLLARALKANRGDTGAAINMVKRGMSEIGNQFGGDSRQGTGGYGDGSFGSGGRGRRNGAAGGQDFDALLRGITSEQ